MDIPPILYHYTNAAGLLGMLDSNSIWLSNIHFQNDAEEYFDAVKFFKKVFENDYPGLGVAKDSFTYDDVYTFSLTTEKDILSQWRGYCPKNGYCLGFDTVQLLRLIDEQEFILERVIYEEDEKLDFIRDTIIGVSPDEYFHREELRGLYWEKSEMYYRRLRLLHIDMYNYAALFKHNTFREEREWRIITALSRESYHYVAEEKPKLRLGIPTSFRSGANGIIPYLNLSWDHEKLDLKEIVIGPTSHPELSEFALRRFFESRGQKPSIIKSKIPYRTW